MNKQHTMIKVMFSNTEGNSWYSSRHQSMTSSLDRSLNEHELGNDFTNEEVVNLSCGFLVVFKAQEEQKINSLVNKI